MKKVIFAFPVFTLLLALVACGKSSNSTSDTNNSGSLSLEMQLLVGTFELENTDLAVTSDQAAQLLPLWEMLQSLSYSTTAATEEVDAVVNQIKNTMTTQQMNEITAMKLTQQDVMTVMSSAGLAFNPSGASSTPGTSSDSNQGVFPGGDMPAMPSGGAAPSGGNMPSGGGMPSGSAGGSPGGGFVVGGDQGFTGGVPGQSSTPQPDTSRNAVSGVPAPLLNALIELLQKKIQA